MPNVKSVTQILKVLKFSVAVLSFAFYVLSLPNTVHAQSPNPYTLTPIPSSVSPTSPLYTDLIVNNMFHTFSCLMIGGSIIGQPCLTYQITQNAEGAIQSVPVLSQVNLSGGALGTTTSLIGMLYANPPVRTVDYLGSLGEQIGIVKPAHAQVFGSGNEVLKPILTLWQVSRNIAYVAMIIVFLIIGLMVLFRNRINPQTVITAQAALPGLVIGLILITFSYFLAALISDMAFVGTNVVGYYFAAAQGKTDDSERTNLVGKISDKSVLNIFGPLTGIIGRDEVSGSLDNIIGELPGGTQFVIRSVVGFLTAQFFSPIAGGVGGIGTTIGTALGGARGFVIGSVAQLVTELSTGILGFTAPTFTLGYALAFIATLALIYAMIRLLLRLISAFLTIIFLTISAPFQFLAASLPGRQGIATAWILNMLANILVFPAVLAVFYFIAFILGPKALPNDYPLKVSNLNQIENSSVVLPVSAQEPGKLVGETTFPLFGGLNLKFINILLAFGALMALPGIPDLIVRTVGRAGQAGQLLGQEISGGVAAGQRYAGQFQGAVSGTGSMVKQSIAGETQWRYKGPGQGWEPYYGRPGIIDIFRK